MAEPTFRVRIRRVFPRWELWVVMVEREDFPLFGQWSFTRTRGDAFAKAVRYVNRMSTWKVWS